MNTVPGQEREKQIALDKTRFSSILSLSILQHFTLNAIKHTAQTSPAGTLMDARLVFDYAFIHIIPTTMSPVLPLIIIS